MHTSFRTAVVVLSLLALALVSAACGGSVSIGTDPTPTQTGPVTYTDADYGYSITHDAMFTKGTSKDTADAGSGPVSDVIFADENGTVASDTYLDAIQVLVYELKRSVAAPEVPDLKAELQGVVDGMLASVQEPKVVKSLSEVEVNGVPGFAVKYTYKDLGEDLTMTTFFLFKDKYEYQVSAQSATSRADELAQKFSDAVQSFTVK